MFGRRTTPLPSTSATLTPPIDSDGKRRVFGEAIFNGPHGEMLRKMGFSPDDKSNIIPSPADLDQMIKESLASQETRRRKIEADLLARHGHNAIRPFFILAEPVFNGALGTWLMLAMKLMPYDEWNLVYLPTDRATQAAMGGDLPLHPLQSIEAIDDLMVERMGDFHAQIMEGRRKVDAYIAKVGMSAAADMVEAFLAYSDATSQRIIDHVGKVRPMIIELIADVQRKAA